MMPYDVGFPKELYQERVREAAEDHLAARMARANRQHARRLLLHDVVSWLRALPDSAGVTALRGRHA